jgi:hypothetical protein
VSWNSVVGIDWSRPLVHDGRLVLEAHAVIKRIFRSVSLVLAARLMTSYTFAGQALTYWVLM